MDQSENWSAGPGGDETSLRHCSVKCEALLSISGKSAICSSCKHVRLSWGKYLSNPVHVEQKETKIRK